MLSKEDAYAAIEQLVTRFGEQIDSYKKTDYNETLVRRDFIDPFFKALGWDVDNSQGYAEAYREVIHEDRVKVGKATKAPDYSFRLPGGKRLFFVEAKKPSVAVKTDMVPAYQVRRYAWSAKLPISLLTDFEELAVYDCNKKPRPEDKASVARIKYLTYNHYLAEFDFLWNTFSKERVLKGSFDQFIASDSNKKGTTTVDKDFLASLDEWRMELAQNIALRNADYTEEELNYTVQQTIDRIIFLRIAEDRGVEDYGRLQSLLKGDSIYHNLYQYFTEADSKYNSGLFDFKRDKLSKGLLIDNKVLKTVISQLYYPISPYEFSVLSVEILGSAYEQFLGKQIKLNSRHKIEVDEKPEVRKAGGVYYTPQYIVDYIVRQTVGKLTESKTPEQISKLRIVDPACGSGSFLIGAYQYLLTWHHEYYKPEFVRLTEEAGNTALTTKQREAAIKQRNKLPLTPDGALTTAVKKTILLNNIYGVDIDTQAVEVTKLSLLLKCMEGETQSSMSAEMRFGERVLPTLDSNIKSGNSLIDLDFYDGQIDFEPEIEKKIKPFSWEQNFKDVFKQGGFDVVIGNPPYVRIQTFKEISSESVDYFKITYLSADYGNYDLYVIFIELGYELLKRNGLLGFILPNKFFNTDYGEGIRKYISTRNALKSIIDFSHFQVFENATTYSCLLFLANNKNETFHYVKIEPLQLKEYRFFNLNNRKTSNYTENVWNFQDDKEQDLMKKISQNNKTLIKLPCEISRGSSTGNDKIFVLEKKGDVFVNGYNDLVEIEENLLIKPVFATDFTRYHFKDNSNFYLIFPYKIEKVKSRLFAESELKELFPLAYKYLQLNKILLEKRAQFQTWYAYSAPRSLHLHANADLIIPLLADKGLYTKLPDDKANYTLMAGGGFSITIENETINPSYLLALLNSQLLFWILKKTSNVFRGGWITCTKQYFAELPIILVGSNNKRLLLLQNEIVKLADTMLALNKEKSETTFTSKVEILQQRIAYTDDKINKLVYELYELTEDEIKIVINN